MMGVGQAIFAGSLILAAAVVLVVVGALRISARRKPRDLSDTIAEQIESCRQCDVGDAPVIGVPVGVWNLDGRHAVSGDTWPAHDEDADEDGCWCRTCYEVELELMQDAEIFHLFAGLVDTPELRELADRARRGIR